MTVLDSFIDTFFMVAQEHEAQKLSESQQLLFACFEAPNAKENYVPTTREDDVEYSE